MSNVKNITSKILKDAEAGKENILAAAEEEKNKIPHRHRFSDSRLNYGFKPLAEAMPGWIEEGLDYLRQEHEG